MATCRECKLFDLDACKNMAGHVLKGRVGRCLWVSKEQYPFSIRGVPKRPEAGKCHPTDGNRCPCFQKRPN